MQCPRCNGTKIKVITDFEYEQFVCIECKRGITYSYADKRMIVDEYIDDEDLTCTGLINYGIS